MLYNFLIFTLVFGILVIIPQSAHNTFAGDTITVPISWCAVNGSRAASDDPNIPNPYGGVDHSTDEVLWRRHERATDNIYNNNPLSAPTQAEISFRSAINDALHTSLNFPKIEDPNHILGTLGDLNPFGDTGQELVDMRHACINEWSQLARTHPGVVQGILAINVRQFINDEGHRTDITGIGYCTQNNVDNNCAPYDGYLFVTDNSFMLYGISSDLPDPDPWMNKDEFDQSVSHELGHALNLPLHRNGDVVALMNSYQQHNGPDARVSNFKIYPEEITSVRDTPINPMNNIPGTYQDPVNKTVQGDAVRTIKVDEIKENKSLKRFEDIALVSVTLNKNQKTAYIGLELYGVLPQKAKLHNETKSEYWTLLDLDNNKNTGTNNNTLTNIGFPITNISGVDLAIREKSLENNQTNSSGIMGNAWVLQDNNLKNISSSEVQFDVQTARIHHIDRAGGSKEPSEDEIALYNTLYAKLNNTHLVKLDSPFSVQSFVISNGTIVDKLDYKQNESKILELSQPLYPLCYSSQGGVTGENAIVSATGLLPHSNIHALLGTRLVANGSTNASGNGTIQFNIPEGTQAGLHLMTIGVDKTALTADCQIKVEGGNQAEN